MFNYIDIMVIIFSSLSLIASLASLLYAIRVNRDLQKFNAEFSQLVKKIKEYTENSSPIKDPETNKEYVMFVKDDDLYLKQIL